MRVFPFIMCGGAGTRLWPMSTRETPKQFHSIGSEHTMLQETALRGKASGSMDVAAPSFICSVEHIGLVKQQCEEVGLAPYKIIAEPVGRNTAAAAAAVALVMEHAAPDDLVVLLPADHLIGDSGSFWSNVARGAQSALNENIVTLGIKPSRPETGYGYIKAGPENADGIKDIEAFVEKPDLATAQIYLDDGSYYWNAGIFLFKPKVVIREFEVHAADILLATRRAVPDLSGRDSVVVSLDAELFSKCRSESFDYAIMENSANASVVGPVEMDWNDIGSWRAVWEQETASKTSRSSRGPLVCTIEGSNVLVKTSGQFVATVGLSDIAVIAMDDSILVIDLDSTQDVKSVVAELKSSGRENLL